MRSTLPTMIPAWERANRQARFLVCAQLGLFILGGLWWLIRH